MPVCIYWRDPLVGFANKLEVRCLGKRLELFKHSVNVEAFGKLVSVCRDYRVEELVGLFI